MLARINVDPARREEIVRSLRRGAFIAVPAVLTIVFAALLAWTFRRQLDTLVEGLAIEPTPEPETELGAEPPYEVGEITPA